MEVQMIRCLVLGAFAVVALLPFTPEAVPLQNSSNPEDQTDAGLGVLSDVNNENLLNSTTEQVVANPITATETPETNDNDDDDEEQQWIAFLQTFRVTGYPSTDEAVYRKATFKQNLKTMQDHNANGNSSFTMGVNQFSDMTLEEFSRTMNGFNQSNLTLSTSSAVPPTALSSTNTSPPLPSTVDWRNFGYVTPVKDQGQCGSCWAFSVTGTLEGQHYRSKNTLVSLSEQNLLDCSSSFGNSGCNGGQTGYAYNYIKSNRGIDTEASYSYRAVQGRCRYSSRNIGATITGWMILPYGDEQALQQAVATIGPISVAIDANHASFQNYKSGIYYESSCTNNLDHAVLVVGYGTSNGVDYWIVKNSWGTSWGNNGYIYMSRNSNNQCGIANSATYPTV